MLSPMGGVTLEAEAAFRPHSNAGVARGPPPFCTGQGPSSALCSAAATNPVHFHPAPVWSESCPWQNEQVGTPNSSGI